MQENAGQCLNCETTLTPDAQFCAQCGQKVLTDEDRRLSKLLRESVAEVTDLQGRVLPSLWALMFLPGQLALAYRVGRRRSFLSPISLFLFANVLYFLIPVLSDFNLTLVDQISLQPYSRWIQPMVDERLGGDALAMWDAGDPAYRQFANQYALRAGDISKSIIIIHVPFLALATFLLTIDRKVRFVDHVVLALHFMAFIMLYFVIAPTIIVPALRYVWDPLWSGTSVWISIMQIVPLIYAGLMFRALFAIPWWRVVPTTLVFAGAYLLVNLLYRLIQFLVVFFTM